MQLSDVASPKLPPRGLQPQYSGTATEEFRENQTGNKLVGLLSRFNTFQNVIQGKDQHILSTRYADNLIPPLRATTPHRTQVGERRTNHELSLPLSSTVVLKRKKGNAVGASGFRDWPNFRLPSRLKRSFQNNHPNRDGQDQTTSPE